MPDDHTRAHLVSCALALGAALAPTAARADDGRAIPVDELPRLPFVEGELDEVADVTIASAQEVDDDRVVGAAKREQSLGSVASAVTVVTPDQLRRFGYRTVAEALSGVAGVYLTDDRAVERVGIRGVQLLGDANTRLLILIDGTPLNEPWAQFVEASYALPVNLDDIARIEVIRGPVSSIYGTNAFLGIVNIVTKSADLAAPAYGSVSTDTLLGYLANAGFAAGDVDRQIRGSVAIRRRGAETLGFVEGEPDTDASQIDALAAGVSGTYDHLFVQVRATQRQRQLAGAPFDAMPGSTDNQTTDRQVIGEIGYTDTIGRLTLGGRAYASVYDVENTLLVDDDGMTAQLVSTGASRWLGGELRGVLDLSSMMPRGGGLDVTAGVAGEVTQTEGSTIIGDGTADAEIDQSFDIEGVYGELNATPTKWAALSAGLRYDRNALFESKLNPRLALLLYREEQFGLKLLYAEGFRNPSIFEAFFEDRRFLPACSPTCETDGTTLFPETIASFEGVLWARPIRGLKLRASAWQWDLRSMIERRAIFDPTTFTTRFQYQNLAELRSRGIELEASFRNTEGWFGYANAALADVRRNVIATPPNSPDVVAAAGVSTPAPRGVHLSTELTFVGERQSRDEEVVADPWYGWNATIYVPDLRGFELTVSVRNLIGTRAQVVAPDDYDRQGDIDTGVPPTEVLFIPGPGREVFARLGYRL